MVLDAASGRVSKGADLDISWKALGRLNEDLSQLYEDFVKRRTTDTQKEAFQIGFIWGARLLVERLLDGTLEIRGGWRETPGAPNRRHVALQEIGCHASLR